MKGLSTVALEVALCNDGDVMVDDDDATIDTSVSFRKIYKGGQNDT